MKHAAKIRVLVVDDSPSVRELLAHMLGSDPGLQVVGCAADGLQAVDMASRLHPDVITMDLQMPNMDGYQAKQALDQRGYVKPVIALTAHAMTEEKTKTKAAGFAGHLTKPIAPDELVKKIRQLLGR